MNERQHGKVVFICDDCGDGLETEEKDFADALNVLRNSDWVVVRDGNGWKHFCKDCAP